MSSRRLLLSAASTACVGVALLSRRGVRGFAVAPSTVAAGHSSGTPSGRFANQRAVGGGASSTPTRCASSSVSTPLRAASTSGDGALNYAELYGNTLLSIRQCIDVAEQQQTTQHAKQPNVVFVDGSWYHKPDPSTGLLRNPAEEYATGPRLPNARYLDIDAIATTYELFPECNPKKLPHMFPPPKLFGLAMDAYDIRNEDYVVVYAKRGALFTPRVWLLFVSMGHDPGRVHLMQGSLEDYAEAGGIVEMHSLTEVEIKSGDARYCADGYADCFDGGILNVPRLHRKYYSSTTPRYNADVPNAKHICDKEEVLEAVVSNMESGGTSPKTLILDTRGSGYAKKGHMPSAIHLPYSQIATPTNSLAIRPKEALRDLFEERGIDYLDPELKIILSCGSGVSVCHGYLALKELGREITEENTRIYDGSWAGLAKDTASGV